jgi:hypothetical protein
MPSTDEAEALGGAQGEARVYNCAKQGGKMRTKLAFILMFVAALLMGLAQWLDGPAVERFVRETLQQPREDFDEPPGEDGTEREPGP